MEKLFIIALPSPRLNYSLALVFRYVLGISYRLVDSLDDLPADAQAVIHYGNLPDGHRYLSIPNSIFLYENHIRDHFEDIQFKQARVYLFWRGQQAHESTYALIYLLRYFIWQRNTKSTRSLGLMLMDV